MSHDYEHIQNPQFPCLWTHDDGAVAQLDDPGWELNVSWAHVMLAFGLAEVVTADFLKVVRAASPCHQPRCQHLWMSLNHPSDSTDIGVEEWHHHCTFGKTQSLHITGKWIRE